MGSRTDEGVAGDRILAWGLLSVFLLLTSVGRMMYWFASIPASIEFEILASWGMGVLMWRWLVAEGRAHRATFPLDAGLFAWSFSFLSVPLLLWRYQRWRSVWKMAALFGIWIAAYAFAYVLFMTIALLRG